MLAGTLSSSGMQFFCGLRSPTSRIVQHIQSCSNTSIRCNLWSKQRPHHSNSSRLMSSSRNFHTCQSQKLANFKENVIKNYSSCAKHNKTHLYASRSLQDFNLSSLRTFRHGQGKDIDSSTEKLTKQIQHEEEVIDTHAGWLIRLANENGYLSWCRNTYITTVAGATVYAQSSFMPYGKEAGILLLMMGGLSLLQGTCSYCYNLVYLRDTMLMYRATTAVYLIAALLHLILWYGAIAIYLGYVEEDEIQEIIIEEIRKDDV